MILTDFAPNESFDDAVVALKQIAAPWRWKKGKTIVKIKSRLKSFFPQTRVSLFLTARAGLYHILQNLDLDGGDEVAVQAFTCEAVILPILALGLQPLYVDIESSTFSMNQKDLEKKLTNRTKVLILQNTFGITPLHRENILDICRKRK